MPSTTPPSKSDNVVQRAEAALAVHGNPDAITGSQAEPVAMDTGLTVLDNTARPAPALAQSPWTAGLGNVRPTQK